MTGEPEIVPAGRTPTHTGARLVLERENRGLPLANRTLSSAGLPFLKAVQERRGPLGPDSTPAGLDARSPHILASMFRWDDGVSRIPESEGSAWLAR